MGGGYRLKSGLTPHERNRRLAMSRVRPEAVSRPLSAAHGRLRAAQGRLAPVRRRGWRSCGRNSCSG